MSSFPYAREFINPDDQWDNVINFDLTKLEPVKVPFHWKTLPEEIPWSYKGERKGYTLGAITDPLAYEGVNKLTNYFADEVRVLSNVKGSPCPLTTFKERRRDIDSKRDKLIRDAGIPDPTELEKRYYTREAVYMIAKECTNFKITLTKAVIQHFKPRSVLDPSAGWGDRLLGAAAAGVKYLGVDPNPRMRPVYSEMMKFVRDRDRVRGNNLEVITDDFLKAEILESFDLVFTSPPFFDFEVYNTEDENQSLVGRETLEEWIEQFFFPYLSKAFDLLGEGGHFVIYVKDVPDGEYVSRMDEYIRRMGATRVGVIALMIQSGKLGRPILVYKK